MLQALNSAVQYQFAGNAALVYVLIRQRDSFFKLRDMTLDGALSTTPTTTTTTTPTGVCLSREGMGCVM